MRKRGRDGHQTRERLLRAALELFTTRGLAGTTTEALAQRAEIAEGTIYRHFPGKEQLFQAAYRRSQEWMLGQIRAVEAERARRTSERLGGLARVLADSAESDPALVRMALRPVAVSDLDQESRAVADRVREGLQQLVATGKSNGEVRPGPADLWAAVWLVMITFATEKICDGEWTVNQAGLIIDAAWEAIAAQGHPAQTD